MAYQIPRGCQDVFGNESYKWQALEQTLRSFCYMYNYDEIRTPIFEHTEVFKRENDSSDMVNKEMYTFKLENSKTSLTLRPEGTAGVVRSFVENKMLMYFCFSIIIRIATAGHGCHNQYRWVCYTRRR